MFSESCKYTIKALVFIAKSNQEVKFLGGKEIALAIDAPPYFLASILQELSRKRIISSMRGPNGGFFMSEEQKNIPIIEIVRMIDGEKLFTDCILGLDFCGKVNPCPMHNQYQEIREKIIAMLKNNTILDFNNMVLNNEAFLVK
jgi:Rrf2 family protein